jgi:mRNA-degrading endonuclease RelE of RelBE toxin-antitoxin system
VRWAVRVTKKADKGVRKLKKLEKSKLHALLIDLQQTGPVQTSWKNFSRLKSDKFHCHLSYHWVVCWEVIDKKIKILEVYYVGSRENAPY